MALDPCPYCSKEFDHNNAGARQNHINSCREDAEKYSGEPSGGQQSEGQTVEMVVEDDSPQRGGAGGGGGGVPARQEDVGLDDAGRAVGEGIRAVQDTNRDPRERAEGLAAVGGTIMQLASGIFESVAESEKREEQAERERAKRADLEPDDGPTCVTDGCNHTFGRLPTDTHRVRCPECGRSYKIRD